MIILSRLLPPQAFGLLAMIAALTEILEQIKDFGLSAATIQKTDITHEQVTALFWINCVLGVAVASPCLRPHPFSPNSTASRSCRYHALAGVGLHHQRGDDAALGLASPADALQDIVSIDVGCELLAMATAVVAALAGAGFWALVAQRLVYAGAVMLATWITSGWRPGWPRRCPGMKSLLVFGGSVTGNGIINVLGRNVDQVLIGWYWGALPLGLYERAYKLLMSPVNTITTPIYSVGMPALSRLHDDPERYRRAYVMLSEKLAMVTVPPAALMVVTADWIVVLLLGAQWH